MPATPIRACTVAALLSLGWAAGADRALAAPSAAFIQQCLVQVEPFKVAYPRPVDWASACACQSEQLRAQGYNPDAFAQEIQEGLSRAVRQPSAPESQEISKAFVRRMEDAANALAACAQANPLDVRQSQGGK